MITILRLTPGEDETRVFTYKDSNGDPIDVTGYTATAVFTVRDVAVTKSVGSGITLGGAAGTFTVVLTEEETANLGEAGHFGRMTLHVTTGTTTTRLIRAALVVL